MIFEEDVIRGRTNKINDWFGSHYYVWAAKDVENISWRQIWYKFKKIDYDCEVKADLGYKVIRKNGREYFYNCTSPLTEIMGSYKNILILIHRGSFEEEEHEEEIEALRTIPRITLSKHWR